MSPDADFAPEPGLAALIDWYLSIGVDMAVDETPHDRFAESAAPPVRPAEPAVARAPSPGVAPPTPRPPAREARPGRAAPVFPEEAARAARDAAAQATTIDGLRALLESFEGCALKATAGHFLFSAGAPGAPLMALDFSPGEEEERGGAAFVGPEARLLDNMLRAIGRDRSSAYLAYATPWRPPGARELNATEVAALNPFLRRHIALAAPRALLILGDFAARAALGSPDVARYRGAWFDYDTGGGTARALLAPSLASLLRTPILKRRAWRDLRAVAGAFG
ncbi:uracil-DNA glycosylase family protein [Methylosinus sp. Ce-a6]|uniref:uracil-DNA glycosylase n=1 Tax=Methylosinus sp. Ce-a6 TaxID=2172005 RepID=UPI0013582F17|nr:uracil-DNA glycosylase [Methylosinus sp. Ce-a6]